MPRQYSIFWRAAQGEIRRKRLFVKMRNPEEASFPFCLLLSIKEICLNTFSLFCPVCFFPEKTGRIGIATEVFLE